MANKISIIVNSNNELTSFEEGSSIMLYNKSNDIWQIEDKISYSLSHFSSIIDTRESVKKVISNLKDCKIIIAKIMSGIPYIIFDRMGFAVFEASSISDSIFEEILSDVKGYSSNKSLASIDISTTPVETEIPGVYSINLIELQIKHPEISSKKALKSFIENTHFSKLEIICSHLPPWLEYYFAPKRMTYIMEELDINSYKVYISKE